jgi:hypothetical protein
MIGNVFAILAALLSILALGLVSGWASQNGPSPGTFQTNGWLTRPSWGLDSAYGLHKFSWHPVLMVAGFFLAQAYTLITWCFTPELGKVAARGVVWFFRAAALACFIAAMCAVVNFSLLNRADALVSLHSWIGVCSFIVFGCSFLWGFVVDFVGSLAKKWELNYDIHYINKFLAITALVLTCTAVCSGITEFTVNHDGTGAPVYVCNFVGISSTTQDNPAYYYDHYPNACKVAYGCGLAVVGATACAIMAITYNGFDPQGYKKVEHASNN